MAAAAINRLSLSTDKVNVFADPLVKEPLEQLALKVQGLIASVSFPNQAPLESLPSSIKILDTVTRGLDACAILEEASEIAQRVETLSKELALFQATALFKKSEGPFDQNSLEAFSTACKYARNTIRNANTYQKGLDADDKLPGNFQISEFALSLLQSVISQEEPEEIGAPISNDRSEITFHKTVTVRFARKRVLHNEETAANEAAVLSFIRHPNAIQLGLVEQEKGPLELVFTLEYAPLGDIETLLEEDRLHTTFTRDRFLEGFKGLLEFFAFIHEKGFKHRDFKPSNLLVQVVDGKIVIKICDFELFGKKELKNGKGTPFYAAKEMLLTGAERGPPSDMWSFGICGLTTLLNLDPYQLDEGLNINQQAYQICIMLKAPQDQFDNQVSIEIAATKDYANIQERLKLDPDEELEKAFRSCLVIDPSKRPTAKELLERLAKKA